MFQSDDCIGQNGFFQIKCNGFIYGEIYGSELEEIVDKEPLYDWFERMLRTVKELEVVGVAIRKFHFMKCLENQDFSEQFSFWKKFSHALTGLV